MDSHCPDNYIEPSAEISVKHTKELITYIRSLPSLPGKQNTIKF